jgi:hypothetical protein
MEGIETGAILPTLRLTTAFGGPVNIVPIWKALTAPEWRDRSSYDDDSDVTETLTILVGGPDAGMLPFALRGSSSMSWA